MTQNDYHYSADNYNPLPVTLVKGQGVYLWDDKGKKYLDMMSAYSAVNHGHSHPKLIEVMKQQVQTLNLTSRGFLNDKLEPFLKYACELTGQEKALPMNSGAESVETAIKAARKWGYQVKHIADNCAEIIVCDGNFHGRTSTIIGFSSQAQYKKGFGPFSPNFVCIPYGDSAALAESIGPNTAAFLVEPIQGEAGIRVPPVGYLKACSEICTKNNVLLICDEIQTGLGRTGKLLACDYENVKPDGLILGKSLGGGMLPISLFLSKQSVMSVFTPGDHGSTFGGNPLAATIGLAALELLVNDNLATRSAELGQYFMAELMKIQSPFIKEIRGKGLFIGIELNIDTISARDFCLRLMKAGLLTKDTHETVIRLCPPLIINRDQLLDALDIIRYVFKALENQ